MKLFWGKKHKAYTGQQLRDQKHLRYLACPLCGAAVKQAEIQEHGYCQICRLLVEALTARQYLKPGSHQKERG